MAARPKNTPMAMTRATGMIESSPPVTRFIVGLSGLDSWKSTTVAVVALARAQRALWPTRIDPVRSRQKRPKSDKVTDGGWPQGVGHRRETRKGAPRERHVAGTGVVARIRWQVVPTSVAS